MNAHLLRILAALILVAGFGLSSQAWAGVTYGVDDARILSQMDQGCTSPNCERNSILPITNSTGEAAVCIQPGTESASYTYTGSNQLVLVYGYHNACGFVSFVWVKHQGQWHNAGLAQPRQNVAVGIVFDTPQGNPPNVIMFCRTAGAPRDDLHCQ
ncbi:hypothetical protein [Pandoraea apista]|uniref:Secreted protein n=1 Tax=Pandoraea apista TaxID=93218 RepID=A0A0B5F4L7_9BURK|nr:hypothetical protein [Pandoraea apista]AJE98315.1 hypothetical protein SG18_09205 [Pandoraea apista]AKH72367.1 hypothetical protein XM39_09405 [Pandoraea apista]AKI60758.1 hypothetical protein AA956_01660 [Pandoraea apista]ALS66209.1 hypothetical protein AT395_15550 [Pandoraea apista]AVF38915.1 hypothetical protein AL486_03645 [Pandoraea apista]